MNLKFFSILFILTASLFIISCSDKEAVSDSFAQCLTEKGAVMYGTEWCSHCQTQKKEFGKAFQFINFVDCDIQKEECTKAGVTGYPTWIIGGNNYPGEQPMYKLASLTKCSFN